MGSGDVSISQQLEIRAFLAKDFEGLYAIDQACYPPSIAYSRAVLKSFVHASDSRTFVASRGARIVGFVTVEKAAAQRGHVNTLDVLQAHRRLGIGRALLDTGERWLRSQGVLTVDLETAVDNLTAIEFWQANGYTTQWRIPRYYAGGVDAWLMRKVLVRSEKQEQDS